MEKIAVTIREAADLLGLHPDTVRVTVSTGQLPAARVGKGKGKFVISKRAVEDLFTANSNSEASA